MSDLSALIVLFLVIAFFVRFIWKGFLKGYRSTFTNPRRYFFWPGSGRFEWEVVGESNYMATLSQIKAAMDQKNVDEVDAFLHPEKNNPHDPNAVAVAIFETQVGYLSRDDAKEFRKLLEKKQIKDQITCCRAKLFGGNQEKTNIGVWLDF